ncbi:hypothetical protein MML48_10g00000195 [Holotrichia oblita]|uniref:Uncharacterized protein n=1 Tax=Holotrichia oblita TaxID=644536 RepID=A0ACB9SHF4_HOLOL|nr:hypothetical protein MML48_10g00000195 [Holotrichia oblita]
MSFETEKPRKKSVLNTSAAWGTLATGSTHSHLAELLSVMDIPSLSAKTFFKIQRSLGFLWREFLWEVMEHAGKEERKLAIEKGDVDEDGIPHITVLFDGEWSKRSYGHSYNAASGVVVCYKIYTGDKNYNLQLPGCYNR